MIITNGVYSVYAHINKVNGKTYVGITQRDPKVRWGKNGIGYMHCARFWNAINKYSWDNFDHKVVASNLTKDEACKMEIILIKMMKTQDPEFGYNIDAGGSACLHTPETIEKIRKQNIGKVVSEETKAKIREARKHQVISRESIEKTRLANIGRKHTEEFKKHLAEAKAKYRKPVICLDTNEEYESIKEASRRTGIGKGAISDACRNPTHKARGLRWSFVKA